MLSLVDSFRNLFFSQWIWYKLTFCTQKKKVRIYLNWGCLNWGRSILLDFYGLFSFKKKTLNKSMFNSVILNWRVIGIGWDNIQFAGLACALQGIWDSCVLPANYQKHSDYCDNHSSPTHMSKCQLLWKSPRWKCASAERRSGNKRFVFKSPESLCPHVEKCGFNHSSSPMTTIILRENIWESHDIKIICFC